jgi:hypothetical protein
MAARASDSHPPGQLNDSRGSMPGFARYQGCQPPSRENWPDSSPVLVRAGDFATHSRARAYKNSSFSRPHAPGAHIIAACSQADRSQLRT